jgi:predicted RecA/RadA family phage recombinase
MATNIINTEGEVMPYTNGGASTIASGTLVLAGAKVGVALADIAASASGNLAMECVVSYAKGTGAGTGGAQGADAYWDNSAKKVTAVSSGNTKIGYFWAACADGDATAQVKLLG